MIDRRIIRFLKRHHVLTVATTVDNEPWCASCFYVYLEERNAFVFTTDPATRHGREFLKNPVISGAIALETRVIGKIRGIQFQGIVAEPEDALAEVCRDAYLRRFPVAMLMETHLWIVDLTLLKLTDNRLGFGKKILWDK
ncbi:MAG: pyridoxamine 5'-phosphate oxidase family protein [Bacteroidales bacterium]